VDCFHEGPGFLAFGPDECVDCEVCIPECPVNAIDADAEFAAFLEINQRLAKQWPVITRNKEPPPDADSWKDEKNKRAGMEL
jgi:ferredoxin